jgi:hypothetical protein
MKTDKTGIEEIRDRIRALDMPYSTWEIVRNLLDGLIASEKPAMEKAQGQQDAYMINAQSAKQFICGLVGQLYKLGGQEKTVCDYNLAIDDAIEAIIFHFPLKVVPKSVEAPKPINPVVAKHNEALGPLRLALWELVEEMEADINERGNYELCVSDFLDRVRDVLEKNPPEQMPTPDHQTQLAHVIEWAKANGYGKAAEWMEHTQNFLESRHI